MPKKTQQRKSTPSSKKTLTMSKSKQIKKSPKKSPTKPALDAKSKANSSWKSLEYLSGFGNHFESEARKGALVKG